MTETNTARVPVSAEIARATNPHRPPERRCRECGERPPAGMVRCAGCRTTTGGVKNDAS